MNTMELYTHVVLHTHHCIFWLCLETEQGCFSRLGGPLLPLAATRMGPQNGQYYRPCSATLSDYSEGDHACLCGFSQSYSEHEFTVSAQVLYFFHSWATGQSSEFTVKRSSISAWKFQQQIRDTIIYLYMCISPHNIIHYQFILSLPLIIV